MRRPANAWPGRYVWVDPETGAVREQVHVVGAYLANYSDGSVQPVLMTYWNAPHIGPSQLDLPLRRLRACGPGAKEHMAAELAALRLRAEDAA